jgi:dTDP-4-amino-4,6-dideoxygalactose transaminase
VNTREHQRFLGIARPDIDEDALEEVRDTLLSGWLTRGPQVQRFEERLSSYVDAPFLRCLDSCTAGLLLALVLNDIGPGDEVLVPANTFVSCANVVEHRGASTVFVDCDPRTGLLDLAHAEHLAGPRTRALIAVHLGGHPVDLDALARLGARLGITIIEDAAHAIGARWRGRPIGSWGNLCSFSFHATKNMTTIEGGALVVGDAAQAQRVERLSLHGLSASAWNRHGTGGPARYDVSEPGFKCAMNDVAAAIGLHQLKWLDGWIDHRDALARSYDEQLCDLPLEFPAPVADAARHARHLYAVRVREDALLSRDRVMAALNARGIGTSAHFHGIHLHGYYRDRYALRPEDLPNSTAWAARTLTLPLHPGLDAADIEHVSSTLSDILAGTA